MDKEFVITYLKKKNYWWNTGKIDEEDKGIERKEYVEEILGNFGLERIICLTGIRRSGKTTLLFQLIETFLKKDISPEKIVYVKIDDLLGT